MPEFSLAALQGLLPQMSGANFGTAGPARVSRHADDRVGQGGAGRCVGHSSRRCSGELAKLILYPEGSEQWSWYNGQKSKAEPWHRDGDDTAGGAG